MEKEERRKREKERGKIEKEGRVRKEEKRADGKGTCYMCDML